MLLSISLLICMLQLCWFGLKSIHQIDFDGIDYVGIATELKQGLFHTSINAFRSPLISWLIAAIPGLSPFQSGKLTTIAAYIGSVVLVYTFTRKLWNSDITAGLAALLFTLARGVSLDAVAFISPDFLLTLLTLAFFCVLLDCVRNDRRWFWLGCIHGTALLAKAIALPWFMVITVAAAITFGDKKKSWRRLASASVIPILAVSFWAFALHSKYGVFTTGSQFRTNLFQSTLGEYRNHRPQTYPVLLDISGSTDGHMVSDPMPPGSWAWTYKVHLRRVLPKIYQAEKMNLPRIVKALTIRSNPGILLGFFVLLWLSFGRKAELLMSPDLRAMILIVLLAAGSLMLAYCMLVVDERYLLPLFPLLIAIGSRLLVGGLGTASQRFRTVCWVLTVASVVWSFIYPSSPFRVQTRDFQSICYQAGNALRRNQGIEVVSIGSGPFPEHGVGWEAGYKAAFFGGKRLIATDEGWPSEHIVKLVNDVQRARPSAILVWSPNNRARQDLLANLPQFSEENRLVDPVLGDVGVVLFARTVSSGRPQ